MDRVVIFGASRGLGAELSKQVSALGHSVTGFARKEALLKQLQDKAPFFEYEVADLANELGQDRAVEWVLKTKDIGKIFCVSGGGPYGPYGDRAFKDHEWAWQVSFLFQAKLVHALLARTKNRPQVIFVGSSVAESAGDPFAASYCAAKHALKGLQSSLRYEAPDFDLRLFSPGYMDTDLLPVNAPQRKLGVYDPAQIAGDLWTWSLTADIGGHKLYPQHPA